jgi:hypothetical protein
MDDSGVADAFYTVLSIGIVLVAAIAISGVVLSATMKQGNEAGAQMAGMDGGMEKGLYCFYYAVDDDVGNYLSGDPDDIVLRRLTGECVTDAMVYNSSAGGSSGAVLWSGYLYVPSDGSYTFVLRSTGQAWAWLDGGLAGDNRLPLVQQMKTFTLELSKGYHPFKAKYFYSDAHTASCSLSWGQGSGSVPVRSFYR